jgi:hypothetical protein
VYGAISTLSPELQRELDEWTTPAVTAELKRSDPVEAARIMHGYRVARRRVLRDAREKLTELLTGVAPTFDATDGWSPVARFSGTAGCSCGCSPGFVLDRCLRVNGRPVDLWIERA